MTARPVRIIDAHVHLWDPARTDWYPYLSGGQELDMGDVTGMSRRFDVAAHRAESDGWNVEAIVNVAAATGAHSVDETLELDAAADGSGGPDAIVGGLPPADTVAEAIDFIERQQAAGRFRGVRPMGGMDQPLPPPEVLRVLTEQDLLFELMAHPDALVGAAEGLAGHDELVVVVEHTGWPRADTDEEFAQWQTGLDALAGLGPQVVCKLSGLAMPLGSMRPDTFARWIEYAIDAFGVDRCMFASNFPVDGMHGTLDELWTTYHELTSGLDDGDRDALFAGTASRVYGI